MSKKTSFAKLVLSFLTGSPAVTVPVVALCLFALVVYLASAFRDDREAFALFMVLCLSVVLAGLKIVDSVFRYWAKK